MWGCLKEILELNDGVLNIVVLLCNWVKANYSGSNASVNKNEYGFTLVNFGSLIPISNQSFTFPLHVEHVLFFFLVVVIGTGVRKWFFKKILVEVE
jgi:hypothetical protein